MNHENQPPPTELEARIVALVLGEASPFEVIELERTIAEHPDRLRLEGFRRGLERVHGILTETGAEDRKTWKLPRRKRNKLLATLRTPSTLSTPPRTSDTPIEQELETSETASTQGSSSAETTASIGATASIAATAATTEPTTSKEARAPLRFFRRSRVLLTAASIAAALLFGLLLFPVLQRADRSAPKSAGSVRGEMPSQFATKRAQSLEQQRSPASDQAEPAIAYSFQVEDHAMDFVPPTQYETVTERVTGKAAAANRAIVPSRYQWVDEPVQVADAGGELVVTPAKYETRESRVMVSPPSQRVEAVAPRIESVTEQTLAKDASIRNATVPDEYKTVQQRVMVTPPSNASRRTPAQWDTVRATKEAVPALRTPSVPTFGDMPANGTLFRNGRGSNQVTDGKKLSGDRPSSTRASASISTATAATAAPTPTTPSVATRATVAKPKPATAFGRPVKTPAPAILSPSDRANEMSRQSRESGASTGSGVKGRHQTKAASGSERADGERAAAEGESRGRIASVSGLSIMDEDDGDEAFNGKADNGQSQLGSTTLERRWGFEDTSGATAVAGAVVVPSFDMPAAPALPARPAAPPAEPAPPSPFFEAPAGTAGATGGFYQPLGEKSNLDFAEGSISGGGVSTPGSGMGFGGRRSNFSNKESEVRKEASDELSRGFADGRDADPETIEELLEQSLGPDAFYRQRQGQQQSGGQQAAARSAQQKAQQGRGHDEMDLAPFASASGPRPGNQPANGLKAERAQDFGIADPEDSTMRGEAGLGEELNESTNGITTRMYGISDPETAGKVLDQMKRENLAGAQAGGGASMPDDDYNMMSGGGIVHGVPNMKKPAGPSSAGFAAPGGGGASNVKGDGFFGGSYAFDGGVAPQASESFYKSGVPMPSADFDGFSGGGADPFGGGGSGNARVDALVNEGKELYRNRDYDNAEVIFENILSQDRYNKESLDSLEQIGERRYETWSLGRRAEYNDKMAEVRESWMKPDDAGGGDPFGGVADPSGQDASQFFSRLGVPPPPPGTSLNYQPNVGPITRDNTTFYPVDPSSFGDSFGGGSDPFGGGDSFSGGGADPFGGGGDPFGGGGRADPFGGGGDPFGGGGRAGPSPFGQDIGGFLSRLGVPMPLGTSAVYQPRLGQIVVVNGKENHEITQKVLQQLGGGVAESFEEEMEDDAKTEAVLDKMDEIMIPELNFKDASIYDVANYLVDSSRERDREKDPDGVGVGFDMIVDLPELAAPAPAAPDDFFGGPVGDAGFFGPDDGFGSVAGVPRVSITLKKVSLRDSLDFVSDITGLKYVIKNGVVVLRPKDAVDEVITRFYPFTPGKKNAPTRKLAPETENPQQQKLRERMERIMIPELNFKEAGIHDVLDFLVRTSRERDTEKDTAGVGIGVDMELAPNTRQPKVTMALRRVSLIDALELICTVNNLDYELVDGRVVLIPGGSRTTSKTHQVDRAMFGNIPTGKDGQADVTGVFERLGFPIKERAAVLYRPSSGELTFVHNQSGQWRMANQLEGLLLERQAKPGELKNVVYNLPAALLEKIHPLEDPDAGLYQPQGSELNVADSLRRHGLKLPIGSRAVYDRDREELVVESNLNDLLRLDQLVVKQEAAAEERRKQHEAFPEMRAAEEAWSTFSLNVSDVSFKLAQKSLGKSEWPDPAKIRAEEFVNAMHYGDPSPTRAEKISCRVGHAAHPFRQSRDLFRIGLRTAAMGRGETQGLNLTLMLDVSGSMEREDRARSLRAAARVLASHLKAGDKVSLIGFARTPRLIADALPGQRAAELVALVDQTPSEGGTNLEAALALASEKAKQHFDAGSINRIVLLTDGAANLGDARPEVLSAQIEALREQGIAFDACGVGADDLNDKLLEALARKGDGRYYVLNHPADADAGFARQLAGALRPSAKNIKVQVWFNPERVDRYRLIGYEKHRLKKEDFRNDAVDAAEMAADESGVAVYEVQVLPEGKGPIGKVSVRFRDVASDSMVELSWPLIHCTPESFEHAPASMQLAGTAAFFAERLKGGPAGAAVELPVLAASKSRISAAFPNQTRVRELFQMIDQAQALER